MPGSSQTDVGHSNPEEVWNSYSSLTASRNQYWNGDRKDLSAGNDCASPGKGRVSAMLFQTLFTSISWLRWTTAKINNSTQYLCRRFQVYSKVYSQFLRGESEREYRPKKTGRERRVSPLSRTYKTLCRKKKTAVRRCTVKSDCARRHLYTCYYANDVTIYCGEDARLRMSLSENGGKTYLIFHDTLVSPSAKLSGWTNF